MSVVNIGINPFILTDDQRTQLVFNNHNIAGYVNKLYSNGVAIVTAPGVYSVTTQVTIFGLSTVKKRLLVMVNGLVVAESYQPSSSLVSVSVSTVVHVVVGDVISVVLDSSSAQSYAIEGGNKSWLSIINLNNLSFNSNEDH